MTELAISIPTMYADHHVLRVRSILGGLDGVAEIRASAAAKEVTIVGENAFDRQQVEDLLREGGYPPDKEPSFPELPANTADESSWYTLIERVTVTNRRDLEMAGDFRMY